jgi:hypothetical protein
MARKYHAYLRWLDNQPQREWPSHNSSTPSSYPLSEVVVIKPDPMLHPDYDVLYKKNMKLSDDTLFAELEGKVKEVPLQKADRARMLTDMVLSGLVKVKTTIL